MKKSKYYRQMLAVVIASIAMSLFWLYWTIGRSINTISSIGLREGYETAQISIIMAYSLLAVALIVVQTIFLMKQLLGMKNGVLFDKKSVKYLIMWAVLWVFYDFCAGNVGQMVINCEFNRIVVHGTIFGIPAIAVVFALLYRMAADVAEENDLTI